MIFESYKDELVPKGVIMPSVIIPEANGDNEKFLRQIAEQGMCAKNLDKPEYRARLDYELSMFSELKYTDYILAVWDICNFADKSDIARGYGRGSCGGSFVLYCIGVVDADPVEHGLYFERFVSKARAKNTVIDGITYFDGSLLCDIDLDFDYHDRQKVIEYINEKYKGQSSAILTKNTLSGKLAFKEAMKIYGDYSEEDANEVSAHIPKEFGTVKPLDVGREESPKFNDFCSKNEGVYKAARKIEDLNKNFGVHPSGIAVAAQKINTVMPVQVTGEGKKISAVDMKWVSEVTVKFDILGLRTLSCLKNACKLAGIKREDIDVNHPSIYAAFQILDCPQGIFQIEADTQFAACKKVKPANLSELSDLLGLARPGALDYIDQYVSVKNGDEIPDSGSKELDKILLKTKGIAIYQETLMEISNKVFGFTLEQAEILRRIVGKKLKEEIEEWKDKIYKAGEERGLEKRVCDYFWKLLQDSASYSFNKSHALLYATLSAATAYVKFNHPTAFYTALLQMTKHEQNSQDEVSKISHELKHFNIRLLPPDLIKSHDDFAIEGKDIRYGLSSIKGLNEKSLAPLEAFKGKPRSNKFEVFHSAMEAKMNMGVLSSLIQSGALSSCGEDRPRMMLEAQVFKLLTPREQKLAFEWATCYNFDLLTLVADLHQTQKVCSDGKVFIKDSRWNTFKRDYSRYKDLYLENRKHPKLSKWWFEKQLLGYSYSTSLKDCFKDKQYVTIDTAKNLPTNKAVNIVAYVEDVVTRKSLKGNRYCRITMSDETGSVTAIMADSAKNPKLTDFINKGGKLPSKKDVISLRGNVSSDGAIFLDALSISDTKIFMKISELK